MAIQMRRGLRADFDPTQLVAGEWAVSVDSSTQNQIVWMCFGAGVVKRMGTYEDFQAMIAEISEDLEADFETELRASVNTILSEVQSLADDVSDDADAVATARTAIESTDIPAIQALITQAQTYASNADTSAQSASSSAQSASNSASSASSSATSAESSKNTASAKATEAQSWAIGGTGTRSGEDTNNAKYWSERAQSTSLAQSDWTETDSTSSSYINHKPFKTVGTGLSVDSNGALKVSNPGTTNYNDLSNKPSINGIALSGNKTLHDLGAQAEGNYLEDGDVPSWAMQPQKPTYNASEVGALPANTPIPSKTSDLTNDSNFITASDIPTATSSQKGIVKPDGTTIDIDGNGTLSVIGGGSGTTDSTLSLSSTNPPENALMTRGKSTVLETLGGSASRAYTEGEYVLCTNGKWYEALTAISQGATLTANGNLGETSEREIYTNLTQRLNGLSTVKTVEVTIPQNTTIASLSGTYNLTSQKPADLIEAIAIQPKSGNTSQFFFPYVFYYNNTLELRVISASSVTFQTEGKMDLIYI